MGKVWILNIAFNRPEWAIDAVRRCRDQNDLSQINHEFVVLDSGYPLPNKKTNAEVLCRNAIDYNYTYLRQYKNLGVSANWEWAIREIGAQPEDIVFGIDSDAFIQQKNYIQATMDVFNSDSKVFYVGMHRVPYWETFRRKEYDIGGQTVYEYLELTAWSVGAFHVGNTRKMGGIHQSHALYGGIESSMWMKGNAMALKAVFLKNFIDEHRESPDPEYQQWKLESATTPEKRDFETWLQSKK
jgi:hypothetical protein